jgi:hypothetical protein
MPLQVTKRKKRAQRIQVLKEDDDYEKEENIGFIKVYQITKVCLLFVSLFLLHVHTIYSIHDNLSKGLKNIDRQM